ncbi:DUF4344 domain-containing metallopeptidase [Kiloniella antarctica]|uniref:DUF4344 domain-containing metallopeptidase n=1 Tax=Kiloniella antarctica TaxID=1550907 RepID=A0ABW5BIQ1_9PROT
MKLRAELLESCRRRAIHYFLIISTVIGVTGFSTLPSKAQDESKISAQEFIAGNVLLTLYHEIGHALVSIYGLPVVGSEEDAVDVFSIIALTEELNKGDLSQERESKLDNYLFSTALYWLTLSEEEDFGDQNITSEHSLDSERFLQHLCMVYGSDLEFYQDLPKDFGVEDIVTKECETLYQRKTSKWHEILAPHWLGNRYRVKRIVVVEDEADPQYKGYRQWLHVHGILDEFENYVEKSFHLPKKITLRLRSCGVANAFWNPQTLEVVLCDEQIAEYYHIYERLLENNS